MTTANSNNGKQGDTSLLSHVLSRIEKERAHAPSGERVALGQVTAADTERGVTVHLRREQPVELLRQGQFVVVEGKHVRFFGTINSFRLATTDPTVGMDPPDTGSPLIRDTLSRSTTYAECNVRMALELSAEGTPRPARTIPGPFSQAFSAGTSDYGAVFGHEDKDHFVVGYPRELDENVAHTAPICVSLKRFVERSNGIFGRSGTGKSVLARLLLSGLISRNSCVNLVFDMHSEYASEKRLESGLVAKGLRELFGKSRVALYTIDEEASRRGGGADGTIRIPLSDISIDDIEALSSELKLGEGSAAIITARQAHRKMGNGWIERLINMSSEEMGDFAKETGAHQGSLEGLKRKLETIADLGFVTRSGQKVGTGIEGLISDLKSGKHVILMFGQYRSTLAYMLVANIITKRIHNAWVSWSEDHEDGKASEPKPLMITIEEAHKFLGRDSATIFGTIAREMR
ncbi:MAG: ATP-binding protein, partial [Chloroflexota bacterium]